MPSKALTLPTKTLVPFGSAVFLIIVASWATLIARVATGQEVHEEKSAAVDSAGSGDAVEGSDDGWRYLLNENLNGWKAFTGVPHKSVKIEGFPDSKSLDCRSGKPYGEGDPLNVFTVEMVDGKPQLNVSGQIYAGLSTVEQFENYHLSTEFKWGTKKYEPRLKKKMDSGVLIHCIGKQGAFWNVWMKCLECQVQEGDCGDFIQLAGTSCRVRCKSGGSKRGFPQHQLDGDWLTIGPGVGRWGAHRSANHEIVGDWNTIDIHTVGDRAVFSVNGNAVMHLKDTKDHKFSKGRPLTRGHIQIQSEGAEVHYRNMRIRPLSELPAKMAAQFHEKP